MSLGDDSGEPVRWLTYREAAEALGIAVGSAKRTAFRKGWARQPGNDGAARVAVPLSEIDRRTPDSSDDAGTCAGTEQQDQGLTEARAAFDSALEAVRASHAAELERVTAERTAELARLQEGHAAALRALGEAHAAEIDRLTAAHRAELRQLARRPWWRRRR